MLKALKLKLATLRFGRRLFRELRKSANGN